jgi:ribonucrease Y
MQSQLLIMIGLGLLSIVAGFLTGFFLNRLANVRQRAVAREQAGLVLEEARREAELTRKAAALEAREQWLREKERFEAETRQQRNDLEARARTQAEKETGLRREADALKLAQERIEQDRREMNAHRVRLEERDAELKKTLLEQTARLEKISGLTSAEARRELWKNLEDEIRGEAARLAQRMREAAAREADREARRLILLAIQRLAADQSIESTVTVVSLPNDEMKGRIIGREGRNIRAFEMATGIDVIIDDTPEAVLLSGFDPVRREVARVALERLIIDGRIHPGRIEEIVQKVTEEVGAQIQEAGEKAAVDAAVHGLAPEVTALLGKLRFRTSSGQNVLKHSLEVSRIAGMISAEMGLDPEVAKRAGLLHDIGKAIDHEQEGPHALVGMEVLRRHGESATVYEAVGAHHGELETDAVYPVLIAAADAISSARPGARRETLESYVRRLQKLEEVADSFPGVERSFAIQAGREIRILVQHKAVNDEGASTLASEIARRIERELQYPGQIKVVVIREMRVIDYAR